MIGGVLEAMINLSQVLKSLIVLVEVVIFGQTVLVLVRLLIVLHLLIVDSFASPP